MTKTLGYLAEQDEIPNSQKFIIKALNKKLSQKDINMRKVLVEQRKEQLPGIAQKPPMAPKAEKLMSNRVRGMFRNGKPFVQPRSGFGTFDKLNNTHKLLLAGALAGAAYYYYNHMR